MSKNFPYGSGLRFFRMLCVCLLIVVCSALGRAQTRTRPDTPVLISQDGTTRALSVNPYTWRGRFPTPAQTLWSPSDETRVMLFVTNLDLMKDEGANAFRADAEDASGRQYPLTIESINPVAGFEWIQAVVVRLNGQIGDSGDVLIRVTWRGMATNRVRLAVGHSGGGPKDDEDAAPSPAPLVPPKAHQLEVTEQQRVGPLFSGDRVRFMEQATFGPRADLDMFLRRVGINVYLEEQFTLPYPDVPYPNLPPQPITIPATCTGDCIRDNYSMYLLQRWFYQDALYGKAQLRRRVAWALSQILVVSGVDTQQPSQYLPYLQVLDRNAFGNYRTLLGEMTLNPAMGNYLDMVRSTRTNPNENYAREILQLFSVGLDKLNQDGTPMLDGQGNRIPTYDQNVVNGFTKVFTGWTLAAPQIPGIPNYNDPMVLVSGSHDTGTKLLLDGVTLPAGQPGATDLNAALDNIFNHPNVGPFVSRQLIQHLVTSDPTPAYVGRVAAVFNNNGQGVRGDLRAVVKAILTDPEARGDVKTDPNYGYLREPALYITNILRQLNARAASGAAGSLSDGYLNPQSINIGQDVFRPPSVFNYYPPDYIVPVSGIKGPEFYLMNTSTSLRRANFGNTIVFNNIPATTGTNTNAPNGTSIDLSEMQALAVADTSAVQLMDALNRKMMHGAMSAQMRSIITTAVLAVPSSNPLLRARTAVYLVATSSQYQVQR